MVVCSPLSGKCLIDNDNGNVPIGVQERGEKAKECAKRLKRDFEEG
jgi:hypothetical protein